MTFHYMIEYKLVAGAYKPIGVWCLGPGGGLDIEIRMLPEYADEQEAADWVINRLVESGVEHVDRALLEYHQETLPPYDGMRGVVIETSEYPSRDVLFDDLLRRIREGDIR